METYSKKQGLREEGVFKYSLQNTHALTGAHCGVSIEDNQRCRQLVDLAVCQDCSYENSSIDRN